MDVLQHENNDLKIMTEKGDNKPLYEQVAAFQEFITTGIDRTNLIRTTAQWSTKMINP